MFVLFAVVLAFVVPAARANVARRLVRLTGTFYRPGETDAENGVKTFRVSTSHTKWIFDVHKAQEGGKFDWQVLQNILPPSFYFMGPKNLIASLDTPEIAGKLITVEGYIHTDASNVFEVTAIKNVAESR